MMNDSLQKVIITDLVIKRMLRRFAAQMVERFGDEVGSLLLLGIRDRGDEVVLEIASHIETMTGIMPQIATMDVPYERTREADLGSLREIQTEHLPKALVTRHVVIVDDVVYTGATVIAGTNWLLKQCAPNAPKSISVAAIVARKPHRFPVHVKYLGKEVPVRKDEIVEVDTPNVDGGWRVRIVDSEDARSPKQSTAVFDDKLGGMP